MNALLDAFRDPTISELIVNDDGQVYVEREGKLQPLGAKAEPRTRKPS